ncbi:GIY-YIG nuclease family protein [Candidatus Uhrbacteria bacterium]|nr:GIY-YIG nuclease family protein [Candidatus Uhrbacteria bacterium]
MYYVYILQSTVNKELYVGSTEDLRTRVGDHNGGRVQSTKPYRPWDLIYYEAHRTKILARRAELFYKSGQGRRHLKKKLGLE